MTGALALSLAATAGLALAPDALATPRAALRRPLAALALHALGVIFLCLCMLLASGRVLFSEFVALALVALMAGVSNAKYASLREPFVFTDLSLFSQLFAHPRLYLPFLSPATVVAIVVGVAFLVGGFLLDTPLASRPLAAASLAALVCLSAAYLLAARLPLSLNPVEDQQRHGFFAVFVAYLLNGLQPATLRAFRRALEDGPFANGAPSSHPDVIVIQSESFFDARRVDGSITPSILTHFDVATCESFEYGELSVPAWGANTMRTEFAMLTGLSESRLGYARFYPYAFVRHACSSLASWFRRAGYQTLAIHPYYADFFGRERVFRLLHLDRFLDIASFAGAPRVGPYVADAAVADAIIRELDAPRDKPAFIFAMTMENHGPLHLEAVAAGEGAAFHPHGDAAPWRDLTAYLRHLANADAMIATLLAYLRKRRRDTVLCFYGDHVPALPQVFAKLGGEPARSDYFIWRNFGETPARQQNQRVEALGAALLRAIEAGGLSETSAGTLHTTKQR
ncbi:LTA synthase family protein [Paraburkholderia phenazinium]|uniref:Phosphoglycerol transferase MdoB n=1 Tax=Paraburkholderia phenazinium TaxID=60549 RepID=A0A1G8DZV4_9BURK|nr:LTA synthase family protein [Paraburkholderia phenazinium]SDH63174.1 Phosphoglycerol transferase MdoB [Paraburkholderia phenazinium]